LHSWPKLKKWSVFNTARLRRVVEAYVSHLTLIRDLAILRGTDASSFDSQEVDYEWVVRRELEPVETEGPMSSQKLWYLDMLLWKSNSRFP
jgi:hypothetical protein